MLALTTRSVIDFWPQEEPSRAYTQGTQWPRYGGCVVARARTHARSWRGKTGQPECDLGPHSQAIKGPHECYCALLSKSPTIYKRLANTHKKYRGEKVAAVTAAATVLCAKQQHNHCAAPDFPSFVQTVRFAQKTFIFLPHSGYLRLANRKPERRAVVVLMARFASPPIIPENLLLHGYIVSLKNATILSNKGAA